jgi:hypothetical protein
MVVTLKLTRHGRRIFSTLIIALWSFATRSEVSFSDPLDKSSDNWTSGAIGRGPSVSHRNGEMVQAYARNSTPGLYPARSRLARLCDFIAGFLFHRPAPPRGQSVLAAFYETRFKLVGDFDAQVDYHLDPYQPTNGHAISGLRVQLHLQPGGPASVERVDWETTGSSVYACNAYGRISHIPTGDLRGTLRLVRRAGKLSGYVKSADGWVLLATAPLQPQDLGPTQLHLSSSFPVYAFPGSPITARFSNFRVAADQITGLQTAAHSPITVIGLSLLALLLTVGPCWFIVRRRPWPHPVA